MSTYSLKGRVAVVTGAASGIGEALARALASRGARLAISDIRGQRLDGLAAELTAAGIECLARPVDGPTRRRPGISADESKPPRPGRPGINNAPGR
jgi:NAD(P)-dependent dehydrogenase (short-subunit alcohol dehydrogenase family)